MVKVPVWTRGQGKIWGQSHEVTGMMKRLISLYEFGPTLPPTKVLELPLAVVKPKEVIKALGEQRPY